MENETLRVKVEIEETPVQGEYAEVDGLMVTCDRCGHQVEVYGRSDASARAAGAKLKEECLRDESNIYEVEESMNSHVDPDRY